MNSGPQTDSFAPAPFIPGTMVLVEVSADIHICGICKQQYSTLDSFVAHKQNGCHLGTTTSAGSVQYVGEGATPSNSTQAVTSTITTQTQTIPDYSTTNIGQPPLSHPSDHSSCVNLEVSNRLTEFSFEQSYQTYLPNSSSASQVSNLTPGPTGISLKKSKSNSTSLKKLTCCYPGCTFKTSHGNKDLDRHLRTHTGEKPFKCDICNKNFSRQDKLKMHNRSHTGEKPYKCQYCDYAAADSSSLKKHLRIHSNERPFKCQICPYASRNSSQLIIHLRSHTGDAPFQCPVCNAKFKINSDLKRHIRIHSGEKPYQCDFCDYRCAMKGNLRSHVRIKHSMENTFKCPQCEFQCGNKSTLRQHTRIHQPDKPIKCAQCSYSCSSRGSLKVHERIHSEDRPFRCKFCTFGSKQRSNLLMHLKKHHIGKDKLGGRKKGEGLKQGSTRLVVKLDAKKPFRCNLCEASFVREDSLRSHKNQHRIVSHGVEDGTLAVLQLQMHHGSQPNTTSVSSHQQPRSVTTFSKAEVKIIVDHQLNSTNGIVQAAVNEHHTMRDAVVSDSCHQNIRDEVVHGNQLQLLQQVSIITSGEQAVPQNEAVVNSSLEQETVLLSPISSSAADSLHQALMQTTAVTNQSFITSSTINCSDLDGLNALIQEDSRGVTVVSSANQNDVTSSSSSITHLLFPVSSNAAT